MMVGGSRVTEALDRAQGGAIDFAAQLRRIGPQQLSSPARGGPDMSPSIRAVASASERMSIQGDEIAAAQKHAFAAEKHIAALVEQISNLDHDLQAALDAADADRKRADDLETFGRDLLHRMQVLFAEAGDRLQAAERRAEIAEADLELVLSAVQEHFSS